MTPTPWYRRKLDVRVRLTLAALAVCTIALGWFGNGSTIVFIQAALLVAAAAILVVSIRRASG